MLAYVYRRQMHSLLLSTIVRACMHLLVLQLLIDVFAVRVEMGVMFQLLLLLLELRIYMCALLF